MGTCDGDLGGSCLGYALRLDLTAKTGAKKALEKATKVVKIGVKCVLVRKRFPTLILFSPFPDKHLIYHFWDPERRFPQCAPAAQDPPTLLLFLPLPLLPLLLLLFQSF